MNSPKDDFARVVRGSGGYQSGEATDLHFWNQ